MAYMIDQSSTESYIKFNIMSLKVNNKVKNAIDRFWTDFQLMRHYSLNIYIERHYSIMLKTLALPFISCVILGKLFNSHVTAQRKIKQKY